ncbi:bacteriochlorophyll 4-vinyl reductase [Cribrihabitans sp. XS_ASV171]
MTVARVGPNAILQTETALVELGGAGLADRVFDACGLDAFRREPPTEMVPEPSAARLLRTVAGHLPEGQADDVLRRAGHLTGEYIIANRIPAAARTILRLAPTQLSARLLLRAIRHHAWTFAGSGQVAVSLGTSMTLRIDANPLATDGCPWHVAVFETLFRELAGHRVQVAHETCCARRASACVFAFRI